MRWKIVRGKAEDAELLTALDAITRVPPIDVAHGRLMFPLAAFGMIKVLRKPALKHSIGESALVQEFDAADRAAQLGILAPRPKLAAESRWMGCLRSAMLITEPPPAGRSAEMLVREQFASDSPVSREINTLMKSLGRLLASLHQSGGIHADFTIENIIVLPDASLFVSDWGRAFFCTGLPDAGVRRLFRIRQFAGRALKSRGVVAAACTEFTELGAASIKFRSLVACDLRSAVKSLIESGVPLHGALRFLNAYYSAMRFEKGERHSSRDAVLLLAKISLRNSIRRTIRNAARGSRKIAVEKIGDATLLRWKSTDADAINRALRGEATNLNVVAASDAVVRWKSAIGLMRFSLPVVEHVACWCRKNNGKLVLGQMSPRALVPQDINPARLAGFVRLLHAFGFRFTRCADGTVLSRAGNWTFRQGSGYLLGDAGAVQFKPAAPLGPSADIVAQWIQSEFGMAASNEFLDLASRPLIFMV